MKLKIKANRHYKIRWVDAAAQGGWTSPEDLRGLMAITTVGTAIEVNKEYISMALSISDHDQVAEVIHIPVVNVTQIKELK